MTEVAVAAAGETSVEVALPEGRSCLRLCCSGWSWIAGVMPLAARHTATSPMMARFGRLPGGTHTGWVSSSPA
jgi:hypothetical protein